MRNFFSSSNQGSTSFWFFRTMDSSMLLDKPFHKLPMRSFVFFLRTLNYGWREAEEVKERREGGREKWRKRDGGKGKRERGGGRERLERDGGKGKREREGGREKWRKRDGGRGKRGRGQHIMAIGADVFTFPN